jgi:hypothetical protein
MAVKMILTEEVQIAPAAIATPPSHIALLPWQQEH